MLAVLLRCTVGIFFFFFFGVRARFGGLRLTYSALYVICTLDGTAYNFVSKIKNYSKYSPMGGKGEQTTGRKRSCWITLRNKAGAPRRFVRARSMGVAFHVVLLFFTSLWKQIAETPVVTVLYVNFCKGLLSDRLLACLSLRLVASRTVDLYPPPQPRVLGFVFWGADWGCRAPLIMKIRCESRLL